MQPTLMTCLLVAAAFSVGMAAINLSNKAAATGYPIAVVNEDSGSLSQKMLDVLSHVEIIKTQLTDRDTAFKQLAQGAVDGVFIISPNFTQTLRSGEYENTLSLYVSTASSAGRPVSEAVTGEALKLWLREATVNSMADIAQQRGYTESMEALRSRVLENLDRSLAQDSILSLNVTQSEAIDMPVDSTEQTPLEVATGWFGALALFAMLLSSNWALQLRGNAMGERLKCQNMPRWQVFAASALATAVVCLAFWIAAMCALGFVLPSLMLEQALLSISAMAVYLVGAAGMSLCAVAFASKPVQLFMVAPALVMANGVIGEMFVRIPTLLRQPQWLSAALPGKWLSVVPHDPLALLPLVISSLAWLAVGLVVSATRKNNA